MADMRALTIRQPWLHAIAAGTKRVENRTWRPPRLVIGTVIALHAGKSYDREAEFPYGTEPPGRAAADSLPKGAVVAVARLLNCHHAYYCEHICPEPDDWNPESDLPCTEHDGACNNFCSPWAQEGQQHWLLDDVHVLPEPIPSKGMLGLWRLPVDVEQAVREQLKECNA